MASSNATRREPGEFTNSANWCEHFERNAANRPALSWEEGGGVTAQERDLVAKSVQTFQLGESGEGRHLIAAAAAHAERTGDFDYITAVRLFVAEEQQHSRELGDFLDAAGMPRMTVHWSDGCFRRLRHLAGLELSIAVLLTAELLANVYYAALRKATGSAMLREICTRLLRDEVFHVRFQCERLAILRCNRPQWLMRITHALHRAFFRGTSLVVWWTHHRVLRAGGPSFREFWRKSHGELHRALRLMDPQLYAASVAFRSAKGPAFAERKTTMGVNSLRG